ncbi:hypothetical protein [Streptomyces sp. NPDC046832]
MEQLAPWRGGNWDSAHQELLAQIEKSQDLEEAAPTPLYEEDMAA